MATIIDNSAVSKEADIPAINPYLYVADPDSGGPLEFASIYFGLVGRDGQLPEHRKRMYIIQDNGNAVAIEQPVITGAGGVPMYNGSPAQLAVDGSFSFKVLDASGQQRYYAKKVVAKNLLGYSGVIAEEQRTVAGNAVSDFDSIECTTATFYASTGTDSEEFNGRLMSAGVDYEAISEKSITLKTPYADGTVIKGRALDPTGQTVSVGASRPYYIFDNFAAAKAEPLSIGDSVKISGGITVNDGLGGDYHVVAGGTGTNDGENYINLDNGLQLEIVKINRRMSRYSETINTLAITSGTLTIDINKGCTHQVTLSENISTLEFSNDSTLNGKALRVELKVIQNETSAKTMVFSGVKWSGGAAPTVTATLGAYDRYVFVTYDGGNNWDGHVAGQDYS